MKTASTLIAAIALSSFALTAHAAPSEGEQLFREGRAAMQDKDYERACTKFAESQQKEPAPGTALNLGECEEQRGRLVAASEAFRVAAAAFTSPDKRRYAAERAESADRRTPRLTVRASASTTGLVVHVGPDVIPTDTEVKMDPGQIVIHAEAPGRRPKELKATLAEGKNFEIDVGALEPEAEAEAPAPAMAVAVTAPSTPNTALRTAGLVVGGVGAASLVVGAVTGVLALQRASSVEERCTPELVCDAEGLAAARSGSTLSLVSTITVAAGATALVGGAVLYLVTPRLSKSSTTGRVGLTPTASHDTAGLLLHGSF